MALSNLDKETTTNLFKMLSLNEENSLEIVKKNYASFGQLKILAEQISNMQIKAREIIKNISLNDYLHSIPMNTKKVYGTYYYLYFINNREILSIISPEEWNTYEKFLGKYYFDYDNIFYQM